MRKTVVFFMVLLCSAHVMDCAEKAKTATAKDAAKKKAEKRAAAAKKYKETVIDPTNKIEEKIIRIKSLRNKKYYAARKVGRTWVLRADTKDVNDPATHFTVLREGNFVGFKSKETKGKNLQSRGRWPKHRVSFAGKKFTSWEQWQLQCTPDKGLEECWLKNRSNKGYLSNWPKKMEKVGKYVATTMRKGGKPAKKKRAGKIAIEVMKDASVRKSVRALKASVDILSRTLESQQEALKKAKYRSQKKKIQAKIKRISSTLKKRERALERAKAREKTVKKEKEITIEGALVVEEEEAPEEEELSEEELEELEEELTEEELALLDEEIGEEGEE